MNVSICPIIPIEFVDNNLKFLILEFFSTTIKVNTIPEIIQHTIPANNSIIDIPPHVSFLHITDITPVIPINIVNPKLILPNINLTWR